MQYAYVMQYDRDVSLQGHCVYGKINFGDQGSQKIRTGTHHFRTSHHPTLKMFVLYLQYFVRIKFFWFCNSLSASLLYWFVTRRLLSRRIVTQISPYNGFLLTQAKTYLI